MDITILFKACVKTVRTTNKSIGLKTEKSNILKISRDSNLIRARDLVKQITKLHDFLVENKSAYLNVVNYLSTRKTMTEVDRQEIDSMAQKILNICTTELNTYKENIRNQHYSKQRDEHYENIIDSVEKYLKQISKFYTETKAVRVKKVIEAHKLSKLETKPTEESNIKAVKAVESKKVLNVEETISVNKPIIIASSPPVENLEDQLSAEEMQMFELENEFLYNELNTLSDEVKQIENKVVHISELQELFTEKVLQQEQDIERIATTVAMSTDNVKDANEQIREAIQRNAGLRVWILFFLLVMSFSLLFLDWYND